MQNLANSNHTNRELELMLAGKKPLAEFHDEISCLPDEDIIPEEAFAPYVSGGQFIRHEEIIDGSFHPRLGRKTKIKMVLFAVIGEEWRIHAMVLLKRALYKTEKWNETLERIEGALLGYTEEENDAWCAKIFSKAERAELS